MTSIAYLGPRGTFTEEALLSMTVSRGAELHALPSATAAIDAVRTADVDYALVAIENAIECTVAGTLERRAGGGPLVIVPEAVVPVRCALLALP